MRSDMSKLLVDRPRYGHASNYRGVRHTLKQLDDENAPTKLSMRKIHKMHYRGKELNEYLAPLYRYLNKQEGRKWDDVYSEIRANINLNTAVQYHVWQHVFDLVEINVQIIDGRVCNAAGSAFLESYRHSGSTKEMYVDPRDGILRFQPQRSRQERNLWWKKQNEETIFKHDELTEYRRIDGIWYEICFAKIDPKDLNETFRGQHDCIMKEFLCYRDLNKYYVGRYPISKCQLNKREIKRFKLNEKRAA